MDSWELAVWRAGYWRDWHISVPRARSGAFEREQETIGRTEGGRWLDGRVRGQPERLKARRVVATVATAPIATGKRIGWVSPARVAKCENEGARCPA